MTFIGSLRQFVDTEYDTQLRETVRLWQQPVPARVAEGEAIDNVEILRLTPAAALVRCPDNLSKFRPPDQLVLSQGDPQAGDRYACVLEDDRGNELVLGAGYRVSFPSSLPRSGWVLDRDTVDVRYLLQGALTDLDSLTDRRDRLLGILQGRLRPRFDRHRERRAVQLGGRWGLNRAQSEAFVRAFSAESYYVVQGPPGTGKTWVLAYLAAALAQEGQRVLVTAFTHRAINNALRKIARETGYRDVFKIGQPSYADDLAFDGGAVANYEYLSRSPYATAGAGFVAGGTCFAVRTNRLRDVRFDTVIFDEAGQVTLPLAIAGMLAGDRYVFIGDHMQMAPVITGQHREEWVTRSVFETLFDHTRGTMLDITYRMNREINHFPSRRFYGGRLKPSAEAAKRRLKLTRRPQVYGEVLDPDRPDVFVEVAHTGRGMRSEEEAELAAGLAAEALACGVPAGQVAIVAPYRAQGRLIRRRLQELAAGLGEGELVTIVVDTVERIQGQERDLVIVSLTTSDPAHAAGRAEFFFQPNRLNVSITRPRVKRIVIGSPHLLRAEPKDPRYGRWVAHFRALHAASSKIQYTA